MKYMLMMFASEAAQQAASKADIEQMHAAYGAYTQALIKARRDGGRRAAAARSIPRRPCALPTARPRW